MRKRRIGQLFPSFGFSDYTLWHLENFNALFSSCLVYFEVACFNTEKTALENSSFISSRDMVDFFAHRLTRFENS